LTSTGPAWATIPSTRLSAFRLRSNYLLLFYFILFILEQNKKKKEKKRNGGGRKQDFRANGDEERKR
jgi:hypothetical protein